MMPRVLEGRLLKGDDWLVRFIDVQKSYDGDTLVVKNLNLDVARGEFLTLLGPSGSGKTTCLMMLAGFEPLTHGWIMLDGSPVHDVPPHKRNIGVVFQNYALFPHMTVAENIAFPLQVRKMSRRETDEKVKSVLNMVRLTGFGNRRPGQLSGGQQQRVALARAIVFDPMLVLMDEPLGALDRQLRQEMQYEIRQIHERLGITVIYVTHDQTEALAMSTRIAVFNEGVIQQVAAPNVIYEEPATVFVAQFIGENNTLGGLVKETSGKICVVELDAGGIVQAQMGNACTEGSRVSLSLRPERVEINPQHLKLSNVFDAQVDEVVYLGDYMRVRLNACGRDNFIIKVPKGSDQITLSKGERLKIGWRTEDCRAFSVPV